MDENRPGFDETGPIVEIALYSIKRTLYSIKRGLYSIKRALHSKKQPNINPESLTFDPKIFMSDQKSPTFYQIAGADWLSGSRALPCVLDPYIFNLKSHKFTSHHVTSHQIEYR